MRYLVLLLLSIAVNAFASDDELVAYEEADPCLGGYVTVEHVGQIPSVARWIAQKRDAKRTLISISRTIMSDNHCVLVPHGLLRADVLALAIEIYEGDLSTMSGDEISRYLVEAYGELQ